MAASNLNLGKASGGVLNIQPADGTTTTSIVLPASGTVTTTEYVNSNNLGNGSTTFNGFGGSGFKNYIINGNFDIWQRATSQTTTGYGSDDRWNNWNVTSTKIHSRVKCTDTERALFNSSFFSRTVVSHITNGAAGKNQNIENVTKLAGKTVTVSFWAKADSTKNIAIEFSQKFGTGGSPSAEVNGIGSQLVSLTSTWQKKTITVTLPSIVGKTLGTDGIHTTYTMINFIFDLSTLNQSGTFDIAQVQLEEGTVATPFEDRPYALELSLCQRYYEYSGGHHWATIELAEASSSIYKFNPIIRYSVNKRVVPTLVLTEYNGFTGIQIIFQNTSGFDFRNINTNLTGLNDKYFTFTADAEL